MANKCLDCIHQKVCKNTEEYEALYKKLKSETCPNIFTIEVGCDNYYKDTRYRGYSSVSISGHSINSINEPVATLTGTLSDPRATKAILDYCTPIEGVVAADTAVGTCSEAVTAKLASFDGVKADSVW